MKAVLLTSLRKMEVFDVPEPQVINGSDVLVKIKNVGVCGSDIHYYTQGRIGSQVVKFPFILGHEASGVVEKTGNNVTQVSPGDRIAIDPAMPCFLAISAYPGVIIPVGD
ncbi:MAG: alcohol dehydrogenase catalytic domain-containing protein [Bacteroidales bacterium]|nr:alcohol dehydrogenase catalytic domain-containing protein [Bacteroidales bacterium]